MSPFLLSLLLLLSITPSLSSPHPVTSLVPLTSRRSLLSTTTTTNTTTSTSDHNNHHKVRSWIIGFIAGAAAGIIGGALSSVLFRLIIGIARGTFRDVKTPSVFSRWIKKGEDLAFLETEDALRGLEMIGRGGCGEVYRGALQSDPTKTIAIKRILKVSGGGVVDPTADMEESRVLDKRMRQLRSEVQTIGHIRHRNLLPLLAHVPRPDCHYLIYEFMKNGSLQDALNASMDGRADFPWPMRLHIAQGVAAGLEYLHTQHKPKIIHRDLKPANILLDDDLEARIADFGLAKAIPDANTHMTTSNIAGTVGYIAPEYHQTLRFTDKCDVYSFGVILAALVTGRTPSDSFFQSTDELSMVKWMRNLVAAGDEFALEVAADERLKGGGFKKQMALALKLACICTVEDPRKRPNTREAKCMLDQIAKQTEG